jgi:hypothetical protein
MPSATYPSANVFDRFRIGIDDISHLVIGPTKIDKFYYIKNRETGNLIKEFVLDDTRPEVDYICGISLIKRGDKFSPHIELATRDKRTRRPVADATAESDNIIENVKARVSLVDCLDNFWHLIHFLESLQDIEIPAGRFSLVGQNEREIIDAIRGGRDEQSVKNIITALAGNVALSDQDINQILHRKERLIEFADGLATRATDESHWTHFFQSNKWVFGYGLKYQILRPEQQQPYLGGQAVTGRGALRGDTLASTVGHIRFTVLVEIKTPATPILGTELYRNGAWKLSEEFTSAISQLLAQIDYWNREGSRSDSSRDSLEGRGSNTVQPQGILVIGSLSQLNQDQDPAVNRAMRETFERFRQSIHGICIITYDELYERARYIVESND